MSDSSFYIIIKCVFIATLRANDYNVSWLVLVSTSPSHEIQDILVI